MFANLTNISEYFSIEQNNWGRAMHEAGLRYIFRNGIPFELSRLKIKQQALTKSCVRFTFFVSDEIELTYSFLLIYQYN